MNKHLRQITIRDCNCYYDMTNALAVANDLMMQGEGTELNMRLNSQDYHAKITKSGNIIVWLVKGDNNGNKKLDN